MALNITRGAIPGAQKVLIYGVEGIGKTTLASRFPDPLFIDIEGGTKHIDVARLDKPTSWQMLVDEVREVRDAPGICKTLVIDTTDWAERLCADSVCAKNKWDSIEKPGYGKGYTVVKEEFAHLLDLLTDVTERGINVVLTAHAQIRKFEQPDELGAYDRWSLKLIDGKTSSVAALVKEWADLVLFANFKTVVMSDDSGHAKASGGKKRVIYTSHHACWDAKNRVGLPDEVEMTWEAIAPAIPNAARKVESGAVADSPATPATEAVEVQPEPEATAQDAAQKPVDFAKLEYTDEPGWLAPLLDLMRRDGVNEAQLCDAVAAEGYYPMDTPLATYPRDFVEGNLIAHWDAVRGICREREPYGTDVPF